MRDDRDIQRSKPASAPEKGRGPQCGKDRRSTTVCPCRHVPTCHGIPAKSCQVAPLASHLPRYPCKSVPGVPSRCPPATVSPRKRVRWFSLSPTWHGIPAKAFQVSHPVSTWHGNPAKAFQVACPAFHLAQFPCKSVSGVPSRLPPATEFPQKRVRCPIPPSTCHGIPAKACQVSHPASHLPRNPRKSVSGVLSLLPTWHGNPAKAFQVSPSASHLLRFPRKSVSGVTFCRPPGTVFPQKRSRCPSLLPTCHGIPAKAFHVAPLAFHLLRQFLSSWDVGTFQQGKLVVFSKKRATIGTPEVGECVHLSENHDVSKKVQLRVCRVMLHLEMTTSCDPLIIRDFAIYVFCGCASA